MRKRLLLCVGLLAVLVAGGGAAFVLLGTTASPAAAGPTTDLRTRKTGSDWPRFLGPTADSISPEKGILSPWPKEGLRVVWEKEVGAGYCMPSISRGRLFHFDRVDDEGDGSGGKARLTACESETGKQLWQFSYPTDFSDMYGYSNGPRCSPTVDDDRVYTYGPEGMLHCLTVADGKVLWKVDTAKKYGVVENFFGVGSCPIVEGDLLIVAVGGSPPGSGRINKKTKGDGSAIVAFDKRTGEEKYRLSDELASYSSPIVRSLAGKRLGLYLARGGLLAFDPATGKEAWHFPWRARDLESVNAATPVVVGDQVLITETYGPGAALLKVKEGGYDVVWDDEKKGSDEKSLQCHWNTPVFADGHVYGSSGRHTENAELRCVELATGKVKWSVPDLTRSSLLLVDGHLICLTEEGVLMLLKVNPEKMEVVSKLQPDRLRRDGSRTGNGGLKLDYPCWAAPVLSQGLLYVRGKDRLYCLELIPAKG